MEKKEILKHLDEIFNSKGFVRKGNTWNSKGSELEKVIKLQKSKFSNSYYLNYGFIINDLNLDGLEMHLFNGLGSLDDNENKRIMNLLDLENTITESDRKEGLRFFVEKYTLPVLQNINSEKDLLENLMKLPHLNDVPLVINRFEVHFVG